MSLKSWEKKVLKAPGAKARVEEIRHELRLAAGLTDLREAAGLSQREVAERIGVSQPRIAALERCHNVTLDVLSRYVDALGCELELTVVKGQVRIPLGGRNPQRRVRPRKATKSSGSASDRAARAVASPKDAASRKAPKSRAKRTKD